MTLQFLNDRDSNDALDNNSFLSGVKVFLHPNISSTVYVLKEIGIKVNDKVEIKKNKLETDYPQKLTEGHCSLCPSHAQFISSFRNLAAHLDQGSA